MGIPPYLCVLLLCLTGARSQVVLTQPESVVKKPGESVRLTCTVSGYSLYSYRTHWVRQVPGKGLEWILSYNQGYSTYYAPGVQGRVTFSIESSTKTYIEIPNLRVDDTAMYYCASPYSQLPYWGSGTFLEVTSVAQSAPLVYIPNPSCGMNSNQAEISLLCLVKDFHPRNIRQTWSSDSGVITTGISKYPAVQGNDKEYTMSSVLKVSAADWKTNRFYYCQAGYNSNNMVERQFETPKIQGPNITSLVPPADFISNQNAVLGCVISGFAPDNIQVSWKKGQVNQRGVLLSSQRRGDATFETISFLTVSMVNWKEGNEYTCEVLHPPSNFKKLINMKYQQGESPCRNPANTCPPCSFTPELLYHTSLNVTLRNGEKYQYKCAQQKCQIKL